MDLFVGQPGDRSPRVYIMNLRAPGLLHAPDRLGKSILYIRMFLRGNWKKKSDGIAGGFNSNLIIKH